MGDLELIFSMLGEQVTKGITKTEDSNGFEKLDDDAIRGGSVAGNARKETEKELGRSVSTNENYVLESEKEKKKLK